MTGRGGGDCIVSLVLKDIRERTPGILCVTAVCCGGEKLTSPGHMFLMDTHHDGVTLWGLRPVCGHSLVSGHSVVCGHCLVCGHSPVCGHCLVTYCVYQLKMKTD